MSNAGTFIVYGVTRKLAHDTAAANMRKDAERSGRCIIWESDAAKEELARLEKMLYEGMPASAISPWYAQPGPAKEFIRLAKSQDGGKNLQIKQRTNVVENGLPVVGANQKPVMVLQNWYD